MALPIIALVCAVVALLLAGAALALHLREKRRVWRWLVSLDDSRGMSFPRFERLEAEVTRRALSRSKRPSRAKLSRADLEALGASTVAEALTLRGNPDVDFVQSQIDARAADKAGD